VRSGALLLALFEDETLRGTVIESCPVLARIPRETLRENLRELVRESAEEGVPGRSNGRGDRGRGAGEPDGATRSRPAPAPGRESALDRYTLDLTGEARAGAIDPIRGRDTEIRQVVDILTRRRQNNPILVGDAGVGKTAVAEGFALRVVEGSVPEPLKEVELRILDLGLLQAGAGVKGEFEDRLKSVIAEVRDAPSPVILFIDEAHALIGAGGPEGLGDAANLLKPALARGELRTIAATTWSEYKKYFEKDPALARRFQLVKVEEPDEDAAVDMLRGLVPNLEGHHGVAIRDAAVRDAVRLSHRYLSERRLPDSAIGVLDTACARVALAQGTAPAPLEDVGRRIRLARAELEVVEREGETSDGRPSAEDLAAELERLEAESAGRRSSGGSPRCGRWRPSWPRPRRRRWRRGTSPRWSSCASAWPSGSPRSPPSRATSPWCPWRSTSGWWRR
jgi:type VI secretion system protein VasG